jgi:hypothetical protein
MTLSITYSLTGAGWSRCSLTFDEQTCSISASYLSDALGNLVLSAVGMMQGYGSVAFGFDEEPGEYRWVIRKIAGDTMSLKILEFPQLWGNEPDAAGKELMSIELPIEDYAKAVEKVADSVFTQHGEAEYLKMWVEHAFPTGLLTLLKQSFPEAPNAA